MATTCKLIAKNVLGSNAADVTFSNIPQTGYADLVLLISARSNRASVTYEGVYLLLNGDTANNMTARTLRGDGSAASSFSQAAAKLLEIDTSATAANATSNTFGSLEVYIPNYAGSTNKSISATAVHETNASTAYIGAVAALWSNTAAITSIKITPSGANNFVSGSSFFLYGITKA
jgi:hypothetical protein